MTFASQKTLFGSFVMVQYRVIDEDKFSDQNFSLGKPHFMLQSVKIEAK